MRSRTAIALCAGALVLLACEAPPPPVADESSRRELATGEVVGFATANGSHAWLGLPYARPPVGELRWRAPRPPQAWSGTREALVAGASCVQLANELEATDAKPGTPVGSEDCLYLNVYAPRFQPGEVPSGEARLPVMVWIHGGGNTIGTGSFYDGSLLAATHDLVVITVNYRLGPFGWFRHPALRADADERGGALGQLRHPRPDPGAALAAGERAGLRRRPGQRDDLRRIRGRQQRDDPAALAARRGALPAGHPSERRHAHDGARRGRELRGRSRAR